MRARIAAWALAAFLALIAPLAGCGEEHAGPTAPVARLGPAVEEVSPAARATRVPIGTVAWARFRAPLDPATIVPANVSLDLDAARIPVTLAYDAATRTLTLTPLAELRIRRTYTVELGPALATADGVALDSTYFWQFTTTSVRMPGHPVPADGATGLGPFAPLRWDATESSAGAVRYDVWTGADSATVAARGGTPRSSAGAVLLSAAAIPLGATVWWAVDVTNLETGEHASGPVWHFTVAAPGAPLDSLQLDALTFSSVGSQFPNSPNCRSATFSIGGALNSAILWNTDVMPAGLRVAGAMLRVFPQNISANTANTALWGIVAPYDGCAATYGGPPTRDLARGALATGVWEPAYSAVVFRSDALAAHLQAAASVGELYGYAFTSATSYTIYSPNSVDLRPQLTVYYYRAPSGTAAATDPATRARAARE